MTLKIWWQAARYHFVPASIFPVCVGSIVSWATLQLYSSWYFFAVLIAIVVNHIALNMTDDYFDFKHSVDHLKPGEKNPYTGGSGTLTSGLITPRAMFKIFTILYFITIILGFYLIFERGIEILIFGIIGVFSSFFYTSPPIKFSHYGFGELGLLINFGPILGLGAFFVQAQLINLEALFATLPCGIMLFSMIVINEIPDISEDTQAGKLTLVARFGIQAGIQLYILSWILCYGIIIAGVALSILSPFVLIVFFVLPLVVRSIQILTKQYDNPQQLLPANLAMIRSHSLLSLLIIGAYIIQGYLNQSDLMMIISFLLLFFLFYIPAAIPTFSKIK